MNASLRDTERRFEELRLVLASNAGAGLCLAALGRFLNVIASQPEFAESYLLEIAPLFERRGDDTVIGLPPELLADLRRHLDLVAARSRPSTASLLEPISALVERATAASSRVLGGDREAVAGVPGPGGDLKIEVLPEGFGGGTNQASWRGSPATRWRRGPAKREDVRSEHVWVPVVERLELESGPLEAGALRRFRLSADRASQAKFEIAADFPLTLDTDSQGLVDVPLAVARHLFGEAGGWAKKAGLIGKLSVEPRAQTHAGRSADLALSMLFYCVLRRATGLRVDYALSPEAAITGGLAPDGTVEAVDEEGLAKKVEACFLSPVRVLVFPERQRDTATAALAQLQERYPGGELALVGVRTARDVFHDRRVVRIRRVPLFLHWASVAWRRRVHLAYALFSFLLAAAFLVILQGPVDRNPVAGEFLGTSLQLVNASGRVVETIEVGPGALDVANSAPADQVNSAMALVDLDEDGINDVCWLDIRFNMPAAVTCRSVGRPEPLWSTPLSSGWPYRAHFEAREGRSLSPRHLAAGALDGSGRPSVYVTATDITYFPSVLFKLDGRTGRIIARYDHPGWIYGMQPTDLDGDGITELVLCGTHQAYDAPVLAVLDPRFVGGTAPSAPPYLAEGASPGLQRWYVRLPQTPLSRVTGYLSAYRRASRVYERPFGLEVLVFEGNLSLIARAASEVSGQDIALEPLLNRIRSTLLPPNGAFLSGHFDRHMAPTWFGTSTDYDRVAAFLSDNGFLSDVPDTAYWTAYRDSVLYWDGDGWVAGRAVENRHYREAVERLESGGGRP